MYKKIVLLTAAILFMGNAIAMAFDVGSDYRERIKSVLSPVQQKIKDKKHNQKIPMSYQGDARTILNAFASISKKACLPFENFLNHGGGSCYDKFDILDLSNKDLSELNLDYAHFYQINFKNSNFTNSSLKNANFGCCSHNSTVHNANFSNADLGFSISLRKCNECNFYRANLAFSKNNSGWYRGANFTEANLSFADFGPSDFRDTVFRNTVIDNANFSGANFSGATIENVKADGAIFLNTTGIPDKAMEYLRSVGAVVDKYTFADSARNNKFKKILTIEHPGLMARNRLEIWYFDLSGINLSNSDLRAFSFRYGNLNNIDMSNVNLEGATILGSPMINVILDGANLKEVYLRADGIAMKDVTVFGADLTGANVQGEIKNVRYNSKPLVINGVTFPPTKFGLEVGSASVKRFHPIDIKELIDVSVD